MSCYGSMGGLVITWREYCLFDYISYAHLSSAGFEHSVCHESVLTSLTMLLTWVVELYRVYWYKQRVTDNHTPKCMSYYGAIGRLVITWKALFVFFTRYVMFIYFCSIWALWISWVNSNQFYYAFHPTCWFLFGLLVPKICNCTWFSDFRNTGVTIVL